MSRLCIKNVPSVSESKLKETFSQIGNFETIHLNNIQFFLEFGLNHL